ncbi:squalene-hopene-cyclase [Penicillium bovifimosum]|uniref:Terpene cyclase/mutase family member n=1 Tax=Penicillium bovifimosum TaxID=126998 RepID=A0A9W9H688_9EURO|nr:squalene-hopene-cyclase [Penicillium bovifimosum]KAJ5139323.1 squalene-hopene-cyclase [Penicillium bovifimosum]
MSQTDAITTQTTTLVGCPKDELLLSRVKHSLLLAAQHSKEQIKPDGHWCGEVKTNVTTTAECVFLYYSLGIDLTKDREAIIQWLLSEQRPDGSWSIAPRYPGDISLTVEAYLALKILGVPQESPVMQKACEFVLAVGGVAKVRIFTRIYLAMFGLFPWAVVPELPPELILVPSMLPISIYQWAAWARATVVPLLIISHHRPIYALPNGKSESNTYLDELWTDPANKMAPYGASVFTSWSSDAAVFAFTLLDSILHRLNGLRTFNPVRRYAVQKCVDWILEHQEAAGDFGDIMPPLHGAMFALSLEGYALDSDPMHRGLKAIERFSWSDQRGKRIQTTVSAFWDTSLMVIGLSDAGVLPKSTFLAKSMSWIRRRQISSDHGDWKVYNPRLKPGAFSFGYFNTWYPDVDDTAAAVVSMIRQDAHPMQSPHIQDALTWLLGMQNADGGWGAFDRDNNKLFLNKIPFSDMEALCDPSTPDVTGHVLEAFGIFLSVIRQHNTQHKVQTERDDLVDRLTSASQRAIYYLSDAQESSGAWFGRWGCNYIYGTSSVLYALAYFVGTRENTKWIERDDSIHDGVNSAILWLEATQNADGGWGETLHSYKDPLRAGTGPSTASQTAWALMALIPYLEPSSRAVRQGVEYLLRTQRKTGGQGATWPEKYYTGTGFPSHFYIGYSFYPHYFPLMALGRYASSLGHRPLSHFSVED